MPEEKTKTRMSASERAEAEKARIREERAAANPETVEQPIVGRAVTTEVSSDPSEASKQDPRIGEQDVPPAERIDGWTEGVRHDQMQGVQSAAQPNDLDPEELLEENLNAPLNSAVRSDRDFAVRHNGELAVSEKTSREMDAGAAAIQRRQVKADKRSTKPVPKQATTVE